MLANLQGESLIKAQANENGLVVFRSVEVLPGQYRIQLDVSQFPLSELNDEIKKSFNKVGGGVTIANYGDDLVDVVDAAVKASFYSPEMLPLPAKTVTVGRVTYGNTMQGSELSIAILREIQQSLLKVPGVNVISPRQRTSEMVKQAARGIGQENNKVSLGSPGFQATIDNAEGVLITTYQEIAGGIELNMELRQARTDRLLSATTKYLTGNVLSLGFGVKPDGGETLLSEEKPGATGKIHLEVSPDKGEGWTYQDKDEISFFATMGTDAYLLLVYQDAGNNLIQILPNVKLGEAFFRSGDYIPIPGNGTGITWKVEPPYGVERLYAFAATKPFPVLKGLDLKNGLRKLNGRINDIFKIARSHGVKPGVAYGETFTILTTAKGDK
jgi:hypothetical protein